MPPPLSHEDVVINVITRFLRIKDIVLNYPLPSINEAVDKLATVLGRKADSELSPSDYVLRSLQGPTYTAYNPQNIYRVKDIQEALKNLEIVAGVVKNKINGEVGSVNYLLMRTP